MKKVVFESPAEVGTFVASRIVDAVVAKPNLVLGLATGSTPLPSYQEVLRLTAERNVDFSQVRAVMLDEYFGLAKNSINSYRYFIKEHLTDELGIADSNLYTLDGEAPDPAAECAALEDTIRRLGGVDLQVLGIGVNGHIAFNEPGTPRESRTHIVTLDQSTRVSNARFFNDLSEVPAQALSQGIATILDASEILLIGTGANKANAVASALEGSPSLAVPASQLQGHQNCTAVLDKPAAAKLLVA